MEENKEETPPDRSRQLAMPLLGGAMLVVLLGALVWLFLRDAPPDVWAEATVPFDPACETGCEEAGIAAGGGHGSPRLEFSYNPAVDDAVAQYGDCMESVFTCIVERGDPMSDDATKAAVSRACVAESICPVECKDRFAGRASGSPEAADRAFREIFLNEDAWCLPKEVRR